MPVLDQQEMINDYLKEIEKVIDVRENLEGQIENIKETISTVNDENKREQLDNRINELEAEIQKINVRGQAHILRIDQLNGVR